MLVRAFPEAIAHFWNELSTIIRGNIMPLTKFDDKQLNNILKRLLSGNLSCWIGSTEKGIHTIVLTEIKVEPNSGTKNLIIFTISMVAKASPDEYISMIETIRKYAKCLRCSNI